MDIEVSNEKAGDELKIHQITERAFLSAPHTDHTEHFTADALRCAGALTISQVAKSDGEIIGHVAISPVTLSGGATGWFGLGPISVLPEYQRLGIGSKIMRSSAASSSKCNTIEACSVRRRIS